MSEVRLIDADALKAEFKKMENYHSLKLPYDVVIDNAPTVCGNNPKWCESCVSKGKCASTRPRGDLISRDALKKAIKELAIPIYGKMVLKAIDNAPTVQQDCSNCKRFDFPFFVRKEKKNETDK